MKRVLYLPSCSCSSRRPRWRWALALVSNYFDGATTRGRTCLDSRGSDRYHGVFMIGAQTNHLFAAFWNGSS
jgi:hypothetical protein